MMTQKNITCPICLDAVRIPVWPICFSCTSTPLLAHNEFDEHEHVHRWILSRSHVATVEQSDRALTYRLATVTEDDDTETNDDDVEPWPDEEDEEADAMDWTTVSRNAYSDGCQSLPPMTCFSSQRICLRCLQQYLDYEKPACAMQSQYKCLFCPTTCSLHAVTERRTEGRLYTIDFLYMTLFPTVAENDATEDGIECPYGCHVRVPQQLDLYRHVRSCCPKFPVVCVCGQVMTRARWQREHKPVCPQYTKCPVCAEHIPSENVGQHCFDKHGHLLCYMCGLPVPVDKASKHFHQECLQRPEMCSICLEMVRHSDWAEHVRTHLERIRNRWDEFQQFTRRAQRELSFLESVVVQHQNASEFSSIAQEEEEKE